MPELKIMHIAPSYPFSPLYKQLLSHYSQRQKHVMYVPVRIDGEVSKKHHYESENVQVIYSRDFHQLDRFLYHHKRRLIYRGIERQVPLTEVQLVHAHYLFSAGGVALELKRTHGIPYIVAVRNTDLNVFFKYALHLRRFGLDILREASAVVFLSPAYRDQLFKHYLPLELSQPLSSKSIVLPNGINDFWLQNTYERPSRIRDRTDIRFAYVGAFTRNKNIETTLKVVLEMKRRGYKPRITLVGNGPDARRIHRLVGEMGPMATILPWTDSQQQLLKVYRESDIFLMPSRTETFGLVYIEAMSQGLPVIYSRGQGIDGYFSDGVVGYSCAPLNVHQIADKVEAIIRNYDEISASCTKSAVMFSWDRIASHYERLYQSIVPCDSATSVTRPDVDDYYPGDVD